MKDLKDDCRLYSDLIDSFELDSLVEQHDDDWQGDSRYLFSDPNKDNRYGILIYGWGSCAGCDALDACDSHNERVELRDQLFDSIKWGTAKESLEYMNSHDWKGDYCCSEEFNKSAIEFLEKIIENMEEV